jgi:energy-converting hydrogenase Eha subunit B
MRGERPGAKVTPPQRGAGTLIEAVVQLPAGPEEREILAATNVYVGIRTFISVIPWIRFE